MKREYQLFRKNRICRLGETNPWLSCIKSTNFEYISEVMKLNANDDELQDFEWKLVTVEK